MSGFFGAVWWFIVTLGVLVTFHEFGHYWVARRCGVKVLKFSVGFGRPLWSRMGADGTRYQIAMIPLGGYVQFLDEREGEVTPAEIQQSFNRQPVFKRIAIVAAGPIANLLLCLGLFWLAFVIGWPGTAPILGPPSGIAAESGLLEGDRILFVAGEPTATWDQAVTPLAFAATDHRAVTLTVESATGQRSDKVLRLDRLAADFDQTDPLGAIGVTFGAGSEALIINVMPDSVAAGKLQAGDRVVSIDGRAIRNWADIPKLVKASAPGQALDVEIERAGAISHYSLVPRDVQIEGKPRRLLGIATGPKVVLTQYGPIDAAAASLAATRKQSREMLGFIARLITGKASSKNLSGAIGIAQVAQAEANQGLSRLLALMATLSLTLCIMNLLPIPVLDGGHLLYYLIELVSGRPVGERVLIAGQYAGLLVLAGLICLAFYNDLVRIFS
ncbi:MAG: RIP metalloprotease RseP [Frankiaceae bacterium]|nr:RIP metalloprotease RseP [Arenimonas sp.]